MNDALHTFSEGFLASESYAYLSNKLFRQAVLYDAVRIITKRYCLSLRKCFNFARFNRTTFCITNRCLREIYTS